MLQAQICGPYGCTLHGWFDDVQEAAKDAYSAAEGAYDTGKDIYNTAKDIADRAGEATTAAKNAAQTACDITQSSYITAGTNLLTNLINNKYTQGVASGVATAQGICDQANVKPKVASFAAKAAAAAIATGTKPPTAAASIPGAIQWRSSRDGLWHYAVPKSALAALQSGGLGGAFIPPPWLRTSGFFPPWATPNVKAYYNRRYNWHSVNTADNPYRASQGLGQTHVEVGTGVNPLPGVQQVPEDTGQNAVGKPIWKKWWFWALVGIGTAGVAGTGYYFVRRK